MLQMPLGQAAAQSHSDAVVVIHAEFNPAIRFVRDGIWHFARR